MSFEFVYNLAIETISEVLDLALTSNIGGDLYTLRNVTTGQFAGSGDVWSLFRDSLDLIGGSQGLAELGIL
jgi:hypothetical protein